MPFKPTPPKTYTRDGLKGMNRDELNTVAVSMNHMPSEETTDQDLVDQILAAQKKVMDNWEKGQEEKKARKEEEKAAFARQRSGTEAATEPAGQSAGHSLDRPVPDAGDTPQEPEEERIWFKVAAGEGKLGKAPLFVALNGESCLVQRGQWVKLKRKFMPLLKDAIITEVEQDRAGDKTLRDVPRFNYQTRSLEEGIPTETQTHSRSAF